MRCETCPLWCREQGRVALRHRVLFPTLWMAFLMALAFLSIVEWN